MIGDHIRARKGGRWNHAIDCGDRTVITLTEDPALPPSDRLRRLYRPEFETGAEAVEVVTHRERVFPPRQVVARAFSRTRDGALAAMFRDSEQFAAWCKAGRIAEPPNFAVEVPGLTAVKVEAPPRNGAAGSAAPKRSASPAAKPAASAKPALKSKMVKARPIVKAKGAAKATPKTGKKPAVKKVAAAVRTPARKLAAKAQPARPAKKPAPTKKAPAKTKARRR